MSEPLIVTILFIAVLSLLGASGPELFIWLLCLIAVRELFLRRKQK